MAIEFYNIYSKERRAVDTEPMISAFWGSSNLGPNATVGQDMGWRLAPELVVRIRKIRQEHRLLKEIADDIKKPQEDLSDTDILFYISAQESRQEAIDQEEDYTDEYEEEIRKLMGRQSRRRK